jgi:hypothetical protein
LTSLCNKQAGSEIGFIDLLTLEIHFVMLYIEIVQNAKKLTLIIIDLIIQERSAVNIENCSYTFVTFNDLFLKTLRFIMFHSPLEA